MTTCKASTKAAFSASMTRGIGALLVLTACGARPTAVAPAPPPAVAAPETTPDPGATLVRVRSYRHCTGDRRTVVELDELQLGTHDPASYPGQLFRQGFVEAVRLPLQECVEAWSGEMTLQEVAFAIEVVDARVKLETLEITGADELVRKCLSDALAASGTIDVGIEGPRSGKLSGSMIVQTISTRMCPLLELARG